MAKVKPLREARAIRNELRAVADAEKARILSRFFKTGPGEYGAGDRFHGVVMPEIRRIVKWHPDVSRADLLDLLHASFHEERMVALLLLAAQYRRSDAPQKEVLFRFYLAKTPYINNWDLVDLTAPHIVGAHLFGKEIPVLLRLADSSDLWERRIAILATHYFIRKGEADEALTLAERLVNDPHDLIHKAVGWTLREIGKRCSLSREREFLDRHAATMPRIMLRYAIERFPEALRQHYLGLRTG